VTSQTLPFGAGDTEEISALIEVLHHTEQRLEHLTAGQVDAVLSHEGRALLLGRAQAQLRENEAARRVAIINSLPMHIALLDSQGVVVSVNEAWRQFAVANGMRDTARGLGTNYLEVCDNASGAGHEGAHEASVGIRAVLDGATDRFSTEYCCDSPTEQRWFLMTVTPLPGQSPVGAVVVHLDVTERRRAELEQRATKQLLADVIENLPTAVHLKSIKDDLRILMWNKASEDLYGLPRAQAIGRNVHDLWPLLDADRMQAADIALLAGGVMQNFPDRVVATRGRGDIHVHLRKVALLDADGNASHILVIADDMTEQRADEARLRESERRFSELLANVELLSLMLDTSATITYCNQYLLKLTGWTNDEVIGRNLFELLIPPENREAKTKFAALLKDSPESWHHEDEILTRSGRRRLIRWNNSVLRDGAGEVTGAASIGEDVTDRRIAEARVTYLSRVHAMLSGINKLIVRERDRGELFGDACRIAVESGGFRMSMIGIMDAEAKSFVTTASAGVEPELVFAINSVLASTDSAVKTLAGRAITGKKIIVSNDLQNSREIMFREKYLQLGVHSIAVLPLMVSGRAVGAFALFASEADFFHEDEIDLLSQLADDIAFANEHLDRQAKLVYLAYNDALTGLANRNLFLERVTQYIAIAESNDHKLAVFLIDIERFKNINDTLGRPAGDTLLQLVAEWLTENAGNAHVVARVGADQFALVLPEVREDSGVVQLLRKKVDAFLQHPFLLNNALYRIAFRAGVSMYPGDGVTAAGLMANAEAALKQAKASGERYLFYTQKMTESVAARLALENHLRHALENDEFVLHYQPKINLANGSVCAVEALIRWNDPRTGMVPPGQFIPILEQTGLIHDVGRWALRKSVETYLRWCDMGLGAVRIAVNVSPLQLRDQDFIEEVKQAISVDSRASSGLELEITESVVMHDVALSIATLGALRAMNLKIAIDDFGTGFSSLSYLARLPVDTLKIDRSFVADMTSGPQGLALVSTIIDLAHAFGLIVVAEGVETEEQSRLLRLLKCDEMQGFLFSKAVPRDVLEARFLTPQHAG